VAIVRFQQTVGAFLGDEIATAKLRIEHVAVERFGPVETRDLHEKVVEPVDKRHLELPWNAGHTQQACPDTYLLATGFPNSRFTNTAFADLEE